MKDLIITSSDVVKFKAWLSDEEKSAATVNSYAQALTVFLEFMRGRPVTKDTVLAFKSEMRESGTNPRTLNVRISAINCFFYSIGRDDLSTKQVKCQRRIFRDDSKDLTRSEYFKLVNTAYARGNETTALILQTLCGTGIRVSELRFVTVEGCRRGHVDVDNKGKVRTIFICEKLGDKLLEYAAEHGITTGAVFLAEGSYTPISRYDVWNRMKKIAERAGVEKSKVFPHNLRHLFALQFMEKEKDIVALADILGHSNINTTRIYLQQSANSVSERLQGLDLVT